MFSKRADHSPQSVNLYEPGHPARKEIDEASRVADPIIDLGPDFFSVINTDALRLASLIDKAPSVASRDANLLIAKVGALSSSLQNDAAKQIIDEVLKADMIIETILRQ